MRFVDVKNDVAFRRIFGDETHSEVLISFLNAILDFKGPRKIVKVNILNPFQLPKLSQGRVTIVDVRAVDQAGRSFIIEMQVADVDGFDKRVLYYTSRGYADQIKRGDFFRDLNPVIFIGVLDFVQTQNPKYISRSQVRDVETNEQTLKDVEFTFIELPKFKKELSEVTTLTDKWIYFIKNSENLDVVPDNVNDKGLKTAYVEANIGTWTTEELAAYDYAFMQEETARAVFDKAVQKGLAKAKKQLLEKGRKEGIEKGLKEGIEKGREEGMEKGVEEERAKTVKKLYQKKKTPEEIADLLDMTLDKIKLILKPV